MPVEIKCRDDIIKLPDIASLRALKKQWNVQNEGPLTNRDDYVRLLLNFYDRMGAPANNKVRRRQKIVIHILINNLIDRLIKGAKVHCHTGEKQRIDIIIIVGKCCAGNFHFSKELFETFT